MKEVYATNNEVEIQMLVGLLESQGILAQVHADGAGGYLRVQGADFNIFKRVVVRWRLEQSTKHSEREWLRKEEKHNKDR